MFENKLKFKETLWEWRAFSLKVDLGILRKICSLSEKSSKPTKMVDNYLFRSGCEINLKIRNEDLRIKKLVKKRSKGIEQWRTEAYGFPLSPVMFKTLAKVFKMNLYEREIENAENLKFIMMQTIPTIRVISVTKQRELYIWPPNDKDGVTIELAEIQKPERVKSIGIEHRHYKKVNQALKNLPLSSNSLKVLNYVNCLEVWAEGKNLSI
jgi:hypothetical protein